ncbi:MAG: ribosome maturation factor RimM, partial [Clostridia bacterium]
MEKILVGKIVKAQGIKGEVKIKAELDDEKAFKRLKYLYIGEMRTAVKTMRYLEGYAYVGFSTIVDRNQAEALKNTEVYAEKEQIILEPDQYFIDDVIDSKVVLSDGTVVGMLKEIMQNSSAADIYVVEEDGKQTMFPLLKDL